MSQYSAEPCLADMNDYLDVAAELTEIHEKIIVVPADKASNNIVFVCKTHYINCLMEELGLSTMTENPTYNLTDMSKEFYKTTFW